MVNIKSTISFDEFFTIIDNVVNSCFIDGEYSSSYYELTLRVSLIKAFAPDYEIPTANADNYNDVWETVTSKEANEILMTIRQNSIYPYIEEAIENKIDYRIKLITSSPMSMSDIALSNLLDIISKKVDEIDPKMFTMEGLDTIIQASSDINDGTAIEKIADAIIKNRSNRATRRKNIKQNKKTESTEK